MPKAPSERSGPLTADMRLVILHGKEGFLQTELTSRLRDSLAERFGGVDTIRFDGSAASAADVLDECRTFGLMTAHKLVVVDQADQFLAAGETRGLLERYAAAPAESATLVLRAEKWHKGKLDALVEAVGAVRACEVESDARAIDWAMKRCQKRHGATLDPDAARALVGRVGPDLGRIDSELAKLSLLVGTGRPIAATDVATIVGLTREEEVWGAQGSLLSGDAARAIGHVRMILESSKRDSHIPLSYACLDLARKLHGISWGLRAGGNPREVAGKFALWGPAFDPVMAAARRCDPNRLAELLAAAVEVDFGMKTGGMDAQRGLEGLALRFAGVLSGR
ncbi:MAG: DNA polymerase III subunit delta [Phycisphaerales bacterium]